jgi:hypothetical protein
MSIHPRWNTKAFAFEEETDDIISRPKNDPRRRDKLSLGVVLLNMLNHLLIGMFFMAFAFFIAIIYLLLLAHQ